MKFNVTWPSGHTDVESTECETADAYAMQTWGRDTAADVLAEFGVTIAPHGEAAEAAPAQSTHGDETMADAAPSSTAQ